MECILGKKETLKYEFLEFVLPTLYRYQEKIISLSEFLVCQNAPFHTANILLLSTFISYKSNDPIFFGVNYHQYRLQHQKTFYFSLIKLVTTSASTVFSLLFSFKFFSTLLKPIFSVFFHVFPMFLFVFRHILILIFFWYSFFFCLSSSGIFWLY